MKIKALTAHTPEHPSPDDFGAAHPGSLCILNAMVCDTRGCGCDRAFISVEDSRAITTVTVTEVQMSRSQIDALMDAYIQRSWQGILDAEDGREMFDEAARLAAQYPAGTVLRVQADGDEWIVNANLTAA
jgi:hypothetical protein